MKGKSTKRRTRRLVSFVVSFVCSFCTFGGLVGDSGCWALAAIPKGTAVGTTTYKVSDVITNWNQLEGLLSYRTIDLKNAYVRDTNFNNYVHLGEETGVQFIAKIDCSYPLEFYPQRILPAFDFNARSFQRVPHVNSVSPPTMILTYKWKTTMSYVYDSTRDNSVTINHGVVDENGRVLLGNGEVVENIDEIDVANNTIKRESINKPGDGGDEMSVVYEGAMNGWTSSKGSLRTAFALPFGYHYLILDEFNSTVKSELDVELLGKVDVCVTDENGAALEGASFNIYSDAECTTLAQRYDGEKWIAANTVVSGSDGRASISNLRPGKYYLKEYNAADGYDVDGNIVEVTLAETDLNLNLDSASGEGSSIVINTEAVELNPKWDETCMKGNMGFEADANNVETVQAAAYNGGADVFIKSGGTEIAFGSPADVAELESLSKLSVGKYELSVGAISESFDSPSDALDYVNTQLIEGALIDDASAQDHVTIEGSNLIYYDEGNSAEARFVESEIPDVPPTGLSEPWFAIPMVLIAVLACGCLLLI